MNDLLSSFRVYICGRSFSEEHSCIISWSVRFCGGHICASVSEQPDLVLCNSDQYNDYAHLPNEMDVEILTSHWLFRSVLANRALDVAKFRANPQMLFSSMVLFPAQIQKEARKVLTILIEHFGGTIAQKLTIATTHCLCLHAIEGEDDDAFLQEQQDCFVPRAKNRASSAEMLRSKERMAILEMTAKDVCDKMDTKECTEIPIEIYSFMLAFCEIGEYCVISYDWIEECLKAKSKVEEHFFLFPCEGSLEIIPQNNIPLIEYSNIQSHQIVNTFRIGSNVHQNFQQSKGICETSTKEISSSGQFRGFVFLLAQHIGDEIRAKMRKDIIDLGGSVIDYDKSEGLQSLSIKISECTHLICRFQTGLEFEVVNSKNNSNEDTSTVRIHSIFWVCAAISNGSNTLPPLSPNVNSVRDVLFRPLKRFGGVPGMQKFVVTFSGFTKHTTPLRDDIQTLLKAAGVCWLPLLSRTFTTHLICFKPSGEKYKRAVEWRFKNIVSSQWIVDCVANWKALETDKYMIKSAELDVKENLPVQSGCESKNQPVNHNILKSIENSAAASSFRRQSISSSQTLKFDVGEALIALNDQCNATYCTTETVSNVERNSVPNSPDISFFSRPKSSRGLDFSTSDMTTPVSLLKAMKKSSIEDLSPIPLEKKTPTNSAIRNNFISRKNNQKNLIEEKKAASTDMVLDELNEGDEDDEAGDSTSKTLVFREVGVGSDELDCNADMITSTEERQYNTNSTNSKVNRKRKIDIPDELEEKCDLPKFDSTPIKVKKLYSSQDCKKEGQYFSSNGLDTEVTAPQQKKRARKLTLTRTKKLPKKPSSHSSKPNEVSSTSSDCITEPSGGEVHENSRYFLLTGTQEEVTINESIISLLGGKICRSGRSFDPKCTHIICKELKRTEKFVAGCASGKWILKPSYLLESATHGKFLEEQYFEWGSTLKCIYSKKKRASKKKSNDIVDPRIWINCVKYWRELIQEHPAKRPFKDWGVYIHTGTIPPPDMCRRVILAGGGIIVSSAKDFNNKMKQKIALFPAEFSKKDKIINEMQEHNIACVTAGFLIDFVTQNQNNPPQLEKYHI